MTKEVSDIVDKIVDSGLEVLSELNSGGDKGTRHAFGCVARSHLTKLLSSSAFVAFLRARTVLAKIRAPLYLLKAFAEHINYTMELEQAIYRTT